jgi:hypothetical protein
MIVRFLEEAFITAAFGAFFVAGWYTGRNRR